MKKDIIVIFMGILMNVYYCIQNDLFITTEMLIYNLFIITIPLLLYVFIKIMPFEEDLKKRFSQYSVFFFLFLTVLIMLNLGRGIYANAPIMFLLITGIIINLIGYYMPRRNSSKLSRFVGAILNLAGVLSIFITVYFGVQFAAIFLAAISAIIVLYYCYAFVKGR